MFIFIGVNRLNIIIFLLERSMMICKLCKKEMVRFLETFVVECPDKKCGFTAYNKPTNQKELGAGTIKKYPGRRKYERKKI